MSILVQFVHPYPERSRVNRALVAALQDLPAVTVNELYARYPNFYVDVEREQTLLRAADLIVFQHPFYWYSGPALLKEWIDVVLAQDFAHGSEAALRGKRWLHSVTTGMPATAYAPGVPGRATMTELLKPFESTASFCGMTWLEPMVFHAAHEADPDRVARHALALRERLAALSGPEARRA